MPKLVKAFSLTEDQEVGYIVETEFEAFKRHRETFGSQYDKIERRVVSGGIPVLWKRAGAEAGS
jgi:hypothetical protein